MYISQDKRDLLDAQIEMLFDTLRQLSSDDPRDSMDANLAYVFSTVLNVIFAGGEYDDVKEALGLLRTVEQEYYRQVAAPLFNQLSYDTGEVFQDLTLQTQLQQTIAERDVD